MKKPRPEALPIAKCKRIVRPLLAKIHVLSDLYQKYPSKFDFDVAQFTKDARKNSREKKGLESAASHLASLKPYLLSELHRAYTEIFAIFRNIYTSLYGSSVPEKRLSKLSTLAAAKLGETVALGTKSSFYRLSQARLFDADTIPANLRKFHSELANDIEEWLDIDPEQVTGRYRNHIVAGYVLHVLVFSLQPVLFMLLPVLALYLHEQGDNTLLRLLFHEFWSFLPQDVHVKLGVQGPDSSKALFWSLHSSGYWERLILHLGVASSWKSVNIYDGMLLDGMALCVKVENAPKGLVLELLGRNPQNPNNPAILMGLFADIIHLTKQGLRNSSTSHKTLETLTSAYSDTRNFVQEWLPLNRKAIFNSQDKGNRQLFEAIKLLLRYILGRATGAIAYLNKVVDSNSSRKAQEMLRRFKFLYYHVDLMSVVTGLFEAYYLCLNEPPTLEGLKQTAVAEFLVDLVQARAEDQEVAAFLVWMDKADSKELSELSRKCVSQLYDDEWLGRDLKRAYRLLHGNE